MDLRKHLLDRNLKWNWEEIAKHCVKNPEYISQVVEYCLDEEVHVQQNAGGVLGKLIDHDKHILDPYLDKMITYLEMDLHDAIKRAILRIFSMAEIPENGEGELFDYIINALQSADEPIAIKAFGMTTARRICEKYPELANELIPHIEIIVSEKLSSGLVHRGRKELEKLRKLQ